MRTFVVYKLRWWDRAARSDDITGGSCRSTIENAALSRRFYDSLHLPTDQPILLYRTDIRKYAHRKILAYFIPITVISTPLGQWTSAHVPVDMLQRIAGILVTLLAVWEVVQHFSRQHAAAAAESLSPDGTDGMGSIASYRSLAPLSLHADDDSLATLLPDEMRYVVCRRNAGPPPPPPPSHHHHQKMTLCDLEMSGTEPLAKPSKQSRYKIVGLSSKDNHQRKASSSLGKLDELDEEEPQQGTADPPESRPFFPMEETSASGGSETVVERIAPTTLPESNNNEEYYYGPIQTVHRPSTGTKMTRDMGTQTTRDMGTQTDFSDRSSSSSDLLLPAWMRWLLQCCGGRSTTTKDDTTALSPRTIGLTLLAGGASGFLGGLCGIRGPPLIAYFLHPPIPFDKETQRATAMCITFVNVSMRMVYYVFDVFRQQSPIVAADSWLYVAVILASIWGCFVGSELFELLKDSRNVIRAILSVFLLLTGVSLLMSSFFGV